VDRQDKPFIAFITTISGVRDAGPKGLKVVISYREDEAYLVAGQVRKSFGFAIVIILVVTSLVSIALSGAIARPIKEIIRGTERIGRGDFSQQITVRSQDEIGDLAQSFNRMAGELQTSREFIENYNRQLEQQVRERSRELEESERKYRMVVEGSGDGWTILDGALAIQFANGRMGEFLGTDPPSLVGRSFLDFVSPSDEERIRQAVSDVIQSRVSPVAVECEMRASEGKRIMFEATLSVISSGASKGQVIAHLVDKTQLLSLSAEKDKLQLELMERSKHSQIGIMTEGLFHNLNNPLQALIGILKVVRQDVERELTEEGKLSVESLDGRRKDLIGDVNDAYTVALRLSDQVKNLLLKIRNESRRKIEDLDINGIIQAEVAFLEADLFFKHKIAKTLILSEALPRLPGVYSDVSQSFVNIILNAVDAMRTSERRELTIETSQFRRKIRVTFHDTGTGIGGEDVPHIFDPFFTTKSQKGQGTGLGLFTVDFLLKPYDVQYEVTSNPGDTSFTILFPSRGLKPKKGPRREGERLS
jgi:PAS domain S-box-containing protein